MLRAKRSVIFVYDMTNINEFDEYFRQGEPDKGKKAYVWATAIGLQAVDGLEPSAYLRETAKRNIEGEIGLDEAQKLIRSYYEGKTDWTSNHDDTEEADRVAANIAKILSANTLAFNANGFISLHRRIFDGVFKFAGKIRDYDITKKEWVLRGDTVNYLNWEDLRRALDYDIEQERNFSYVGLTENEIISHLTKFVSGLWQIHPFGEGNTRTTAVFTIQYLRSIGFNVSNDLFAKHAWYFRNALVRANYKNVAQHIEYTPIYLERFFRNLLLGEQWELRNRHLIIHPSKEWSAQANHIHAEQVSSEHRTSTEQVPNKLKMENPHVLKLISTMGERQMKVTEMMEAMGMKHRPTFLANYLNPAIDAGVIALLYPNSPRHPRQRYLLTPKGLLVLTGNR